MKKIRSAIALLLTGIISAQLTGCAAASPETENTPQTAKQLNEEKDLAADNGQKTEQSLSVEELYAAAVNDAMTIESEEILPVISLAPGSADAVYNEKGDKVLLLTWHKYPDSYPDHAEVTIEWGEVWTFSPAEIAEWYDENSSDVKDWDMRFRQLIGLKPDTQNTHFTAMWVEPEDILRPAYVTEIDEIHMTESFETEPDADYKEWFDANIINSYFDDAYPWTRLGYTYDWSGDGGEYGLSEFLVEDGAQVEVEYTCTTKEFLDKLEKDCWK